MIVGTLEVRLRMDGCHSLKEKRSVIKPILEKTRLRFGVSSAEVGDQELWNASILGFSFASSDAILARNTLSRVLEFIEMSGNVEVIEHFIEIR